MTMHIAGVLVAIAAIVFAGAVRSVDCDLPQAGATIGPTATVFMVGGPCIATQGRNVLVYGVTFIGNASLLVNATGVCSATLRDLRFESGAELVVFGQLGGHSSDCTTDDRTVTIFGTSGVDSLFAVADVTVNRSSTSNGSMLGASSLVVGPDNHWVIRNRTSATVPRAFVLSSPWEHKNVHPLVAPFVLGALVQVEGPRSILAIRHNHFETNVSHELTEMITPAAMVVGFGLSGTTLRRGDNPLGIVVTDGATFAETGNTALIAAVYTKRLAPAARLTSVFGYRVDGVGSSFAVTGNVYRATSLPGEDSLEISGVRIQIGPSAHSELVNADRIQAAGGATVDLTFGTIEVVGGESAMGLELASTNCYLRAVDDGTITIAPDSIIMHGSESALGVYARLGGSAVEVQRNGTLHLGASFMNVSTVHGLRALSWVTGSGSRMIVSDHSRWSFGGFIAELVAKDVNIVHISQSLSTLTVANWSSYLVRNINLTAASRMTGTFAEAFLIRTVAAGAASVVVSNRSAIGVRDVSMGMTAAVAVIGVQWASQQYRLESRSILVFDNITVRTNWTTSASGRVPRGIEVAQAQEDAKALFVSGHSAVVVSHCRISIESNGPAQGLRLTHVVNYESTGRIVQLEPRSAIVIRDTSINITTICAFIRECATQNMVGMLVRVDAVNASSSTAVPGAAAELVLSNVRIHVSSLRPAAERANLPVLASTSFLPLVLGDDGPSRSLRVLINATSMSSSMLGGWLPQELPISVLNATTVSGTGRVVLDVRCGSTFEDAPLAEDIDGKQLGTGKLAPLRATTTTSSAKCGTPWQPEGPEEDRCAWARAHDACAPWHVMVPDGTAACMPALASGQQVRRDTGGTCVLAALGKSATTTATVSMSMEARGTPTLESSVTANAPRPDAPTTSPVTSRTATALVPGPPSPAPASHPPSNTLDGPTGATRSITETPQRRFSGEETTVTATHAEGDIIDASRVVAAMVAIARSPAVQLSAGAVAVTLGPVVSVTAASKPTMAARAVALLSSCSVVEADVEEWPSQEAFLVVAWPVGGAAPPSTADSDAAFENQIARAAGAALSTTVFVALAAGVAVFAARRASASSAPTKVELGDDDVTAESKPGGAVMATVVPAALLVAASYFGPSLVDAAVFLIAHRLGTTPLGAVAALIGVAATIGAAAPLVAASVGMAVAERLGFTQLLADAVGGLKDSSLPRCFICVAADLGAALTIAAAAGFARSQLTPGACRFAAAVGSIASVGLLGYFAVVRPFRSQVENVVSVVMTACVAVLHLAVLAAVFGDPETAVSGQAASAVGLLSLVATVSSIAGPVVLAVESIWCGTAKTQPSVEGPAALTPGDDAQAPLLVAPAAAAVTMDLNKQHIRASASGSASGDPDNGGARVNPLESRRK